MLSTTSILSLPLALLIATTASAQCVTPGYVPCLPQGSTLGGVNPDNFGNSGLWDSLQGVASDPIQKKAKRNPIFSDNPSERRALGTRLSARQDALCCAPDPDKYCLLLTDENVPFCYDSTTTRFVFSDESYGYINNGTYYAADGTFVDFKDGTYSMTNGETGSFAAATSAVSAQASGTPAATVPGTGKVTSVAAAQGSGGSGTSPSASSGGGGSKAGSGGSSPSPSSSSSSGSSSSSSGSQPKSNQGMELRVAGAWALAALAAGFVGFSVL